MEVNGIIITMILVCLGFIFLMILSKPIKFMLKVLLNSVLGIVALMISNFVLQPLGIYIGINLLTAGFIGVLGLPGFAALILIKAIL